MSAPREWNSDSYHRLSNPQFGWAQKVLQRLEVRGDETVADAGCGTGRVTAELKKRLPRGRIFALDLSENMLRQARAQLPADGRVRFILANLTALPLRPGSLDGVFSTAVFHWITDHPRLFREIFAVLKPGGWLEAQCGGGPNLKTLRERATAIAERPEYQPFFEGWGEIWEYVDAGVATDRLRDAGFVDVEAWLEHTPAPLGDAVTYREYLETVTCHRHAERIRDLGLRELFFDELVNLAADDDPPFVMDYWRLNLRGKKPEAESAKKL